MSESYITIWVCTCCMFTHANGECCASADHGGDGIEPLSWIESPSSVSMGMHGEDHDDTCLRNALQDVASRFPGVEWPDLPDDYECDCETDSFSRHQCEGCGSYLHGERQAMTLTIDA